MHLCAASVLLPIAALQQAYALVLPSRHQLAHELRLKHTELHRLSHPSLLGDKQPQNPEVETTLSAETVVENKLESQKPASKQGVENGSANTVTICFEAVPLYPKSGAEEHSITVDLNSRAVSDPVRVPKLAYSVGINRTAASYGSAAGRQGPDSVVCRLSIQGSEAAPGSWPVVTTFGKADGMVPLSRKTRHALESGESMAELSCAAVVNDEL